MNLKLELLTNAICDAVKNSIADIQIDTDRIIDTESVAILNEIRDIIQNQEFSDFEIVENIIIIFEKYNISAGCQHDF